MSHFYLWLMYTSVGTIVLFVLVLLCKQGVDKAFSIPLPEEENTPWKMPDAITLLLISFCLVAPFAAWKVYDFKAFIGWVITVFATYFIYVMIDFKSIGEQITWPPRRG